MKIKEAQSQWLQRAYDIALAKTESPEFALAFTSKLLTQTRLNPTHNSAQGVGIAQLSKELEDVDPLNPEEALTFAADRDAAIYSETGDMAKAMVGQTASQQGDEIATEQMQQIMDNQSVVNRALLANGSQGDDSTFSELDSPETRFRQSVLSNDLPGTTNVIDEMINLQVKNRAAAS